MMFLKVRQPNPTTTPQLTAAMSIYWRRTELFLLRFVWLRPKQRPLHADTVTRSRRNIDTVGYTLTARPGTGPASRPATTWRPAHILLSAASPPHYPGSGRPLWDRLRLPRSATFSDATYRALLRRGMDAIRTRFVVAGGSDGDDPAHATLAFLAATRGPLPIEAGGRLV